MRRILHSLVLAASLVLGGAVGVWAQDAGREAAESIANDRGVRAAVKRFEAQALKQIDDALRADHANNSKSVDEGLRRMRGSTADYLNGNAKAGVDYLVATYSPAQLVALAEVLSIPAEGHSQLSYTVTSVVRETVAALQWVNFIIPEWRQHKAWLLQQGVPDFTVSISLDANSDNDLEAPPRKKILAYAPSAAAFAHVLMGDEANRSVMGRLHAKNLRKMLKAPLVAQFPGREADIDQALTALEEISANMLIDNPTPVAVKLAEYFPEKMMRAVVAFRAAPVPTGKSQEQSIRFTFNRAAFYFLMSTALHARIGDDWWKKRNLDYENINWNFQFIEIGDDQDFVPSQNSKTQNG